MLFLKSPNVVTIKKAIKWNRRLHHKIYDKLFVTSQLSVATRIRRRVRCTNQICKAFLNYAVHLNVTLVTDCEEAIYTTIAEFLLHFYIISVFKKICKIFQIIKSTESKLKIDVFVINVLLTASLTAHRTASFLTWMNTNTRNYKVYDVNSNAKGELITGTYCLNLGFEKTVCSMIIPTYIHCFCC